MEPVGQNQRTLFRRPVAAAVERQTMLCLVEFTRWQHWEWSCCLWMQVCFLLLTVTVMMMMLLGWSCPISATQSHLAGPAAGN